MIDRAPYLKHADECLEMAKTAAVRDQKLLLGIAETFLKLAEETLREKQENSARVGDSKEDMKPRVQ
jgi:hypothetical protein